MIKFTHSVATNEALNNIAKKVATQVPKNQTEFVAKENNFAKPIIEENGDDIMKYLIRTTPSSNKVFKQGVQHVFIPRFSMPINYKSRPITDEEISIINSGGASFKA